MQAVSHAETVYAGYHLTGTVDKRMEPNHLIGIICQLDCNHKQTVRTIYASNFKDCFDNDVLLLYVSKKKIEDC
ncbi:hypothetical protein L596_005886 [Steinernema carpocapsae]|uniref:Uncharacterized protein n=1 Tax=Steinernema carpocapsae TaxID=34508 RepID=A0A4U8V6N3_STECR|nr:hypothetical protein L596_005886 [Steinernema carpocapsae]